MAKAGGSETSAQTQIPGYITRQSKANLKLANEIAAKPLSQYPGQDVADTGALTNQANATLATGLQNGMPESNAAAGVMGDLTGYQAPMVSTQMIPDVNLQEYLNPYTGEVENKALDALNKSRTQALMSNADRAVASKSFGGTRSAITDAVTNSESADAAGRLSAELRSQGFNTALQTALADLARKAQVDMGNQGADISAAGVRGNAANALATWGDNAFNRQLKTVTAQQMGGQQQQAQAQALIDAQKGRFNEARDYDLERLNVLQSALGMTPYSRTVTQSTSRSPDWATFGAGALQAAGGIYGSYQNRQATGAPAPTAGTSALGGAATGASLGSMIAPGIGTGIGAGVGALGGYLSSLFG